MTQSSKHSLFSYVPFRILLPTAIMVLLIAGSIFIFLLPSLQTQFMETRKNRVKELTGSVVQILQGLENQAEDGLMTRQEAQKMALRLVRQMRYGPDKLDYFWIHDTTPAMVMHPYRPELDGSDLSDYKDPNGKRLFVAMVDVVRKRGGGFVDYFWQWKDQPSRVERKISYVLGFAPWGWIVGTGIYAGDIEHELNAFRNRLILIFMGILLLIIALEAYVLRQYALTEERKAKAQGQREKLLKAIKEGEERYRTIADFGYDWETWTGVDGTIQYCSPSCERITGFPPERFFERPELIRELVIPEDRDSWDAFIEAAEKEDGDNLDFRITTATGSTVWINAVGRPVSGIGMKPLGVRCSFRDITDRKHMEEQLRHQALHDPLTGLANRTLCLDRIDQAMHRAKRRENYYFAVIFLDLDRFKVINDSLGHRFGDRVLSETAHRLTDSVRTLDTVSRFGGDEFVIILDELASPGEAIRIVKRIRESLANPMSFDGNEVQTTASFGIVLSPIGQIKAADVLQHANIAMHRAKESGRNRFKVFTGRMLESAVDLLTLENDMRRGLEAGEFHLEYQPIMDLDGADLVGFEALARWSHPDRGDIPPSEFIPMAEESGLIIQLGEWVLSTALKTLAHWRRETPGAESVYMSVNLSTKQFARMELDKMVLNALREADLPAAALKLEITESAIMEHPEAAVLILQRLRKMGVHFSIDDFGTGYSSLSQLQKLPVDTLKVDRSFIDRMESDPENMEIVKAVIALAHSLGLEVVAEGVEQPEQVCSLLDLACERVQGFYFHKPMSSSDAVALLMKRAAMDDTSPRHTMHQVKDDCRKDGASTPEANGDIAE